MRAERLRPGWSWAPAAAFAWLVLLTVRWLVLDEAFFFGEPARHLGRAVDLLLDPRGLLAALRPGTDPPLGAALLALAYAATGFRLDLALAIHGLAFAALLLAAVHALGRELQSTRAGALAVAVLALYPEVFVCLRLPQIDLPASALAAATVYALVRSRGFSVRRWSLLAGLALGAGQLVRHEHLLVLAGPLLVTLRPAWRERRLRRAGEAAAVAALVVLPWWLPGLLQAPGEWQWAPWRPGWPLPPLSVAGLARHSLGLWCATSLALFLLFAAALPAALRSPLARVALPWAASAYLALTLWPGSARSAAYLLPAVALLTGAGLDRWRRAGGVAAAAVGFGAVHAWAMSFGAAGLPRGTMVDPATLAEPMQLFSQHTHREQGFWPDGGGWGLARPLRRLEGRIGVLDPHPGAEKDPLRAAFLRQATEMLHLPGRAAGAPSATVEETSCFGRDGFAGFDRVLVPFGAPGSALAPSRISYACLHGLTEVQRLPVVRGPGRSADDFLGLAEVRVLQPDRGREPIPWTKYVDPVGPATEIAVADLRPMLTRSTLDGLLVRVRNTSSIPQRGRCGFRVAALGRNPWTESVHAAPEHVVALPAFHSATLEFAGATLPPGKYVVAVYLHWTAPATGRLVPLHHASVGITLEMPPTPAARPGPP